MLHVRRYSKTKIDQTDYEYSQNGVYLNSFDFAFVDKELGAQTKLK